MQQRKKSCDYNNNELLFKNKDINKLYLNSQNFLYTLSAKYQSSSIEKDDLMGVCNIAFMKAYQSYIPEKGVKWITYLSKICINEIFMYLRQNKKHIETAHYEEILLKSVNGHVINYIDTISSSQNIEEEYMDTDIVKYKYAALNKLSGKKLDVLLLAASGLKQSEIGIELNLSQSYISRILDEIEKKMSKLLKNNQITLLEKENEMIENKKEFYQFVEEQATLFTSIEIKVARLLAKGYNQSQVASELNFSSSYISLVTRRINEKVNMYTKVKNNKVSNVKKNTLTCKKIYKERRECDIMEEKESLMTKNQDNLSSETTSTNNMLKVTAFTIHLQGQYGKYDISNKGVDIFNQNSIHEDTDIEKYIEELIQLKKIQDKYKNYFTSN